MKRHSINSILNQLGIGAKSIPIAVAAVLLVAAGLSAGLYLRSDYVPPEHIDEMVDEHTRAMSALRIDYREIQDSLKTKNEALAMHIKKQEEELQLYAEMTGRLRIERDSLQQETSYNLPVEWFESPDTHTATVDYNSLTFRRSFTDSLFEVRSDVYAMEGQLFNDLQLNQLRDIDLRMTVTEREESNTLVFYAEIPEMDIQDMVVYRPDAHPRPQSDAAGWLRRTLFSRRMMFVGGTLTGIFITSKL